MPVKRILKSVVFTFVLSTSVLALANDENFVRSHPLRTAVLAAAHTPDHEGCESVLAGSILKTSGAALYSLRTIRLMRGFPKVTETNFEKVNGLISKDSPLAQAMVNRTATIEDSIVSMDKSVSTLGYEVRGRDQIIAYLENQAATIMWYTSVVERYLRLQDYAVASKLSFDLSTAFYPLLFLGMMVSNEPGIEQTGAVMLGAAAVKKILDFHRVYQLARDIKLGETIDEEKNFTHHLEVMLMTLTGDGLDMNNKVSYFSTQSIVMNDFHEDASNGQLNPFLLIENCSLNHSTQCRANFWDWLKHNVDSPKNVAFDGYIARKKEIDLNQLKLSSPFALMMMDQAFYIDSDTHEPVLVTYLRNFSETPSRPMPKKPKKKEDDDGTLRPAFGVRTAPVPIPVRSK